MKKEEVSPMRRQVIRIVLSTALTFGLLAGIFIPPVTQRSVLSSTVPTTTPTKATSVAPTLVDGWFPLLQGRVNQPAYAYPAGPIIMVAEWITGLVLNRQPVVVPSGQGSYSVDIYPPDDARAWLNMTQGSSLAPGSFGSNEELKTIVSSPVVRTTSTYDKDKYQLAPAVTNFQWRTQLQFQAPLLREPHSVRLYKNMDWAHPLRWSTEKPYTTWALPAGISSTDSYNAVFDYGGTNKVQVVAMVRSRTLLDLLAEYHFAQRLGKRLAQRPNEEHPERLAGVTIKIRAKGLTAPVKVQVYDRLFGTPTLALDGEELRGNEETAVRIVPGRDINVVVDRGGVTATPFPTKTSPNGDQTYEISTTWNRSQVFEIELTSVEGGR
jgi:hypothetical protein